MTFFPPGPLGSSVITDDELSRTIHEWRHMPRELLDWQIGDNPACLCQALGAPPTLLAEVCHECLPEYETDPLPSQPECTSSLLGFLNRRPDS